VPDDLDETIEETFPASDAPGNTPETGIQIDPTEDVSPPDTSKQDETPPPDRSSRAAGG
jgi:hypothetical protein